MRVDFLYEVICQKLASKKYIRKNFLKWHDFFIWHDFFKYDLFYIAWFFLPWKDFFEWHDFYMTIFIRHDVLIRHDFFHGLIFYMEWLFLVLHSNFLSRSRVPNALSEDERVKFRNHDPKSYKFLQPKNLINGQYIKKVLLF